jgi:hypothetical protein
MRATTSRRNPAALPTAAVALVAVSLVLGGCSSGSTPSAAPTASSSAPTEVATPTPVPVTKAPLTGVVIEPGTLTNASIASKIDNHVAARPQVGLQYTDLVFEELVEGGLTRYVAVWQSDIPKLYGPVRSIRGMDPSIVSPLGGIMTYSGGQPVFVSGMQKTDVVNVIHGQAGAGNIFYRTPEKSAPHNVIVHADDLLKKYGKNVEAPRQQFPFAATVAESTAVVAGKETQVIRPTFSDVSHPSWEWYPKKDAWVRSQNGVIDRDDKGEALTAINVITMRVKLKTIAHTPVSQLVGSGKATVSSGGKTIEGTWEKKSKKGKISFVDDAGAPIALAPGNSWIELVATGGSVSFD